MKPGETDCRNGPEGGAEQVRMTSASEVPVVLVPDRVIVARRWMRGSTRAVVLGGAPCLCRREVGPGAASGFCACHANTEPKPTSAAKERVAFPTRAGKVTRATLVPGEGHVNQKVHAAALNPTGGWITTSSRRSILAWNA